MLIQKNVFFVLLKFTVRMVGPWFLDIIFTEWKEIRKKSRIVYDTLYQPA